MKRVPVETQGWGSQTMNESEQIWRMVVRHRKKAMCICQASGRIYRRGEIVIVCLDCEKRIGVLKTDE